MKKLFKILLVLLLVSANANALSSKDIQGFNDLTVQQQAEIIKTVADKKAQIDQEKLVPVTTVVQETEKWVNLGTSIGKGLASTAKELGVAVNDFAKTNVGQWTMFLIIFNIMGDEIIHFIFGILILLIGVTFTTVLLNRRFGWEIQYTDGKISSKKRRESDGDLVLFWFGYLTIFVMSSIIIATGG